MDVVEEDAEEGVDEEEVVSNEIIFIRETPDESQNIFSAIKRWQLTPALLRIK